MRILVTGGGFGGSAIAIVSAGASEHISKAITEAFIGKSFGPPRFLLYFQRQEPIYFKNSI